MNRRAVLKLSMYLRLIRRKRMLQRQCAPQLARSFIDFLRLDLLVVVLSNAIQIKNDWIVHIRWKKLLGASTGAKEGEGDTWTKRPRASVSDKTKRHVYRNETYLWTWTDYEDWIQGSDFNQRVDTGSCICGGQSGGLRVVSKRIANPPNRSIS